MEEGGKFASEVLSPLNWEGDQKGTQMDEKGVVECPGFKDAYDQYVSAGWTTMPCDPEFGGMGIEGAVKLGYKKELESIEDLDERKKLFDKLVAKMYDVGQAIEAASFLEIDAVIDPADTRQTVLKAFQSAQGNL